MLAFNVELHVVLNVVLPLHVCLFLLVNCGCMRFVLELGDGLIVAFSSYFHFCLLSSARSGVAKRRGDDALLTSAST